MSEKTSAAASHAATPAVPNGPVAAALVACAIGCFALGVLAVAGDGSKRCIYGLSTTQLDIRRVPTGVGQAVSDLFQQHRLTYAAEPHVHETVGRVTGFELAPYALG